MNMKFEIGKYYKYKKYDAKSEYLVASTKYYECVGDNNILLPLNDEMLPYLQIGQSHIEDFEEVSKEEALSIDEINMETKLNGNEVKEVARMQQMIDSYEGFICALFMMMSSKKGINYPSFTDTNLDNEMNKIWQWVKEHKDKL